MHGGGTCWCVCLTVQQSAHTHTHSTLTTSAATSRAAALLHAVLVSCALIEHAADTSARASAWGVLAAAHTTPRKAAASCVSVSVSCCSTWGVARITCCRDGVSVCSVTRRPLRPYQHRVIRKRLRTHAHTHTHTCAQARWGSAHVRSTCMLLFAGIIAHTNLYVYLMLLCNVHDSRVGGVACQVLPVPCHPDPAMCHFGHHTTVPHCT